LKRSTARTTGMLAVSILIAVFAGAPLAVADTKVTLCHATKSYKNPYKLRIVDQSSVKDGHGGHTGPIFDAALGKKQRAWGDIIPAIPAIEYLGLNAQDGEAWLLNSCKTPKTPLPETPGITLDKTYVLSGSDILADADETITYSFLVANTGSVPLSGIEVADLRAGVSVVTCPSTTLAAEDEFTCTATYLVTTGDVVGGLSIFNEATAAGWTPDEVKVTDTDTVDTPTHQPGGDTTGGGTTGGGTTGGGTTGGGTTGGGTTVTTTTTTDTPSISLVKLATLGDTNHNHASDAGETISYSFVVTNTGNVALSDVAVADLMAGVSAVTCPSTTLTVGATVTCTAAAYTVTDANVAHGLNIVNEATASGLSSTGRVSASDTVSTPTVPSSATEKPVVKPVVQVPPVVLGVDQSAPGAKAPSAAIPAATTLAFTGAEPVPLSLLALFALVLGVALTVAGRRQGGQGTRG
jgi:uncharacterized repeat protein (TIGR01451 family)